MKRLWIGDIYLRNDSYYDRNTRSWYRDEPKKPERYYIEVNWTSGGMTGGSCWGGEHYAVEPDMPEELVDLNKDSGSSVSEHFVPAIQGVVCYTGKD